MSCPAMGPSPNLHQGRVPTMASLWTFIQAPNSRRMASSFSSGVPSARRGTESSMLPFLETMSISSLATVWALLYQPFS